jgi:DNA-directed RNA polymerase subunit RPC12/RpoP
MGSLLYSNDADRNLKLSFQPMKCPYCGQEIRTPIASLADESFLLRTRCEKCGKEFLIVEGVPMTDERYSKHNPPRA